MADEAEVEMEGIRDQQVQQVSQHQLQIQQVGQQAIYLHDCVQDVMRRVTALESENAVLKERLNDQEIMQRATKERLNEAESLVGELKEKEQNLSRRLEILDWKQQEEVGEVARVSGVVGKIQIQLNGAENVITEPVIQNTWKEVTVNKRSNSEKKNSVKPTVNVSNNQFAILGDLASEVDSSPHQEQAHNSPGDQLRTLTQTHGTPQANDVPAGEEDRPSPPQERAHKSAAMPEQAQNPSGDHQLGMLQQIYSIQPAHDALTGQEDRPSSPRERAHKMAGKQLAAKPQPPKRANLPGKPLNLSPQEVMDKFIKKPRGEDEKTKEVVSIQLDMKLTAAGRQNSRLAWNQVLTAMGVKDKILLMSPINSDIVEVYLDVKHLPEVETKLRSMGENRMKIIEHDKVKVKERDTARRARAYTRGYFLPLRRAALQGFSAAQQTLMLQAATLQVNNFFEGERLRMWLRNITVDAKALGLVLAM